MTLLLPGTPEHTAFWAEYDARQKRERAALAAADRKAEREGWAYEFVIEQLRHQLRAPDGTVTPLTEQDAFMARYWINDGRRVSVTVLRKIVEARR